MKFDVHFIEDVAIMMVKGKLLIGMGDVVLRDTTLGLLNEEHLKIVANLSGVTTIDSSGIGQLVGCYSTTSNRGGRFKLCNVPKKIIDILVITQLITVFEIFDSEQEAVESF